jgi:protein-tyrosine phosphatase
MAQRNDDLHAKLSAQEGGYKSLKARADQDHAILLQDMHHYRQEVLDLEALVEALKEKLAKREAKKAKVTP